MAVAEDRRRIGTRLTVVRVAVALSSSSSSAVSGSCKSSSTPAIRRWPRTTISGCCHCARRVGCMFDRNGQGAGREPQRIQRLHRARAHQGSRGGPSGRCPRSPASPKSRCERPSIVTRRAEPIGRSRGHRTPTSGAGGGDHGAAAGFRVAGRASSGSADPEVPGRRAGRPLVRLCRRGQRGAGRRGVFRARAPSSASKASRRFTTGC